MAAPGARSKVDFLFTISGALTMEPKQARLKASFPGFIATLEKRVRGLRLSHPVREHVCAVGLS